MPISNDDTICAIATPPGVGGIGVIRISGPSSLNILRSMWRGKNIENFISRQLYLGNLMLGNRLLDQVFAVYMAAPHTYTGQDLVEYSCHGSPIVLRQILDGCIRLGARLASPGEFTRRAFLSGKLDLIQAEGVANLINATSDRSAKIAAEQLAGRLSTEIKSAYDQLSDLRAYVEASIDFPEEDIEYLGKGKVADRIEALERHCANLSDSYQEGRLIVEGVRVVIAGRPNVGKSSLFNKLVGHERAIVHNTPGTTRDIVEEFISIDGVPFRMRDTAGVREAPDEVERLGIERTREELAKADIVIAIFDGSFGPQSDDLKLLESIEPARSFTVINKVDIAHGANIVSLKEAMLKWNPIQISAKTGEGIEDLKAAIVEWAVCEECCSEGAIITSERHKLSLDNAIGALRKAAAAIIMKEPIECIAQHLTSGAENLASIIGLSASDDLLDRIFSKFCIGK